MFGTLSRVSSYQSHLMLKQILFAILGIFFWKASTMSLAFQTPRICRRVLRPRFNATYSSVSAYTPILSRKFHSKIANQRPREEFCETQATASIHISSLSARRRFTTSPVAMHGHLDPPKPGEEWVPSMNLPKSKGC